MKATGLLSMSLLCLLPAAALAHGAGSHPADPNLKVDPAVEDCAVAFSPGLTQAAYGRFAREFGATSAFKQASPSTTLGKWGFAVDLAQYYFSVEERSAAWNDTFVHPDSFHELGANKSIPKLRFRLGVRDDLDLGAYFTTHPLAYYGWLGVEAKYGLLKQSETLPVAVTLRGAYTKTLFVKDMDMHALGTDATVGRTFFGVVTPYLGVGADAVLARETSAQVNLKDELQLSPHLTGGLEVRFWHLAVGAEAQLAAVNNFGLQVSGVF